MATGTKRQEQVSRQEQEFEHVEHADGCSKHFHAPAEFFPAVPAVCMFLVPTYKHEWNEFPYHTKYMPHLHVDSCEWNERNHHI